MSRKGSLAKSSDLKKEVALRLRIASGHLAAVERMVDEDRYCIDILKQIAAVQASLSRVARALSEGHMKHCVREAFAEGQGEAKVDELLETLKYLRPF